jgi:hypothetical protein
LINPSTSVMLLSPFPQETPGEEDLSSRVYLSGFRVSGFSSK